MQRENGKNFTLRFNEQTPMDELAKGIEFQILNKLQAPLFSIYSYKTTHIAQLSCLLVYVCFNRRRYAVLQTPREHL